MEQNCCRIIELVNNCILSKLSKEYYENDVRAEYVRRHLKLKEHFQELLDLVEQQDFTINCEMVSITLCHLIILYYELLSSGPWNTEDTKAIEKSEKINELFVHKYNINLNEVLSSNSFDSQVIFDKCIRELHKNMTADNLKKYPTLVDVYCKLLNNMKNYKININPVTVLPMTLLLMDDYVTDNKIKGLQCCIDIMRCLATEDFIMGNYYEVVYSSLKKNITEKNKKVTQALFDCFIEYLKVIPADVQKKKLDDLFSSVVDQLYTESNLYRKVVCFNFAKKMIELHGIHCVRKKSFKTVICDNLDTCSDDSVSGILLPHILECLITWIQYCWCVWTLSEDHKMLSTLFKILYLSKDTTTRLQVQNIIITLIKLCADEEQTAVLENLQRPFICSNEEFLASFEKIKQDINI